MTSCAVVVALRCEAEPLIAALGLALLRDAPFPVYGTDGVRLVVSGVGSRRAAMASAWLGGSLEGRSDCAWLNVGVAGHVAAPLGAGFLAASIEDHNIPPLMGAQRRRRAVWYPQCTRSLASLALQLEHVRSEDRVVEQYPSSGLSEMEAAGFFDTVSRWCDAELSHAYKVVSDNADTPVSHLNAARITELMESRADTIEQIVEKLSEEARHNGGDDVEVALREIHDTLHLSVTQRRQARELLRRAAVGGALSEVLRDGLDRSTSARVFLGHLRQAVDEVTVDLEVARSSDR